MAETTRAPAGHEMDTASTLEGGGQTPDVGGPPRVVAAATIGRFVLLRKLGEGGMGEVFSAYDELLDRRVAIKLLHASHAPEETRRRLLREAQALARLSHPNVVAIHEVGSTADGDVFAVMEHIDGTTLRDWQAARTPRELIAAYRMAGSGLTAVHAAGMVHRDFKPANVMVDRTGRVRLLDFGLAHARLARADDTAGAEPPRGELTATLTVAGRVLGTPAYMSPEQYMHEHVGPASDQFSFCLALYEALFGVRPFPGPPGRVCVGDPPIPPSRPDVPTRVTAAMLRGLSRDPSARFASMAELCDALDPRPDPSGQRRERIVVAALLAGSVLAWIAYSTLAEDPPVSSAPDMLWPTVVGVGMFVAVALHFRDTLLRNTFHRARLLTIVVIGVLIVVSRVVGVRRDDEPIDIAVRDLLLIAAAAGVAAVRSARPTWQMVAAATLPALGVLAIAVVPNTAFAVATVAANAALLLYLADWHAASRRGSTSAAEHRSP